MEFVTLSKELLTMHIDAILEETSDFEFNNWIKENYYFELLNKWELSIAAITNSSISGFSINSEKNGIFYIHYFYIFKESRDSNFGTSLLNECQKKAEERNYRAIRLKCSKNNTSAFRFYIKNGFKILDLSQPDNELYLMEKQLIKQK